MKVIYVITVLFFFSCNKDSGPTTVEGRVVETGSNKAIPYAEVYLVKEKAEFFSSALNVETLQTIKADGQGKFSFSFDADEDYIYGVNAQAEGYLYTSGSYISLERGSKNKKDIPLNGYGYLKYHIKNVQNKYVIFTSEYCFDSRYFGENTDTSVVCRYNGNAIYRFNYMLVNYPNDTLQLFREIYIPAHDTASITIEY
jgi:hypothetical protein